MRTKEEAKESNQSTFILVKSKVRLRDRVNFWVYEPPESIHLLLLR